MRLARSMVNDVEFSCEDATRSDPRLRGRGRGRGDRGGRETINIPDTVGYTMPTECLQAFLIRELYDRCPALRDVILSVHCHNDLGLAVANSLAGVPVGARQVEGSRRRHRRAGRQRGPRGDRDGPAHPRRPLAGSRCASTPRGNQSAPASWSARMTGYPCSRTRRSWDDNALRARGRHPPAPACSATRAPTRSWRRVRGPREQRIVLGKRPAGAPCAPALKPTSATSWTETSWSRPSPSRRSPTEGRGLRRRPRGASPPTR